MTVYREALEEDLPGIHAVAQSTGMAGGRTYETWRRLFDWATEQSRACFGEASDPLGIVAEDGGRIVGYATCSYRLLQAGRSVERAVVNNALAVSPHAQGSVGLLLCREFFRMINNRVPGARILGLHHSKPVGMIWQRLGATSLAGSNMTLRVLVSPASVVAGKLSFGGMFKFLFGLPPIDAFLGHLLAHRGLGRKFRGVPMPGIAFHVSKEPGAGLAGSELYSGQAGSRRFGIRRDHAYLKWRYCDHPESKYRFVTLRRREEIIGLLVFAIDDGGYCRLYDALILRNAFDDAGKIGYATVAAARHLRIGVMATKLLEPAIAEIFEEAGAVTERKDYDQFWYTGERGEELIPHFSYGDFSED
jgi:hypothetical protein